MSGLFIFMIQILIWSYSVAVISQLYLAWIQDKEKHTLPSNILTVFYSSSALHPACPFFADSCPTNDTSDPFWQQVGSLIVCCHIFEQPHTAVQTQCNNTPNGSPQHTQVPLEDRAVLIIPSSCNLLISPSSNTILKECDFRGQL